MGHEVADATLITELELVAAFVGPLVPETDQQAPVEEGHHLEPLGQRLEPEPGLVEDRPIGPEADRGPAPVVRGVADLGQAGLETTTVHKVHVVVPAVPVDLDLDPGRQGIDHRDADAMEPARHLVALAAEFAAGVEHGEDHLGGRHVLVLVVDVDRNTTPVVRHLARSIVVQGDLDGRAVAGHGLVDGVVDDLPDQVVEAGRTGRSDVHAGPLPDGFEALQNGDVGRPVGRLGAGHRIPSGRVVAGRESPLGRGAIWAENRWSEGIFTVHPAYQRRVPQPRISGTVPGLHPHLHRGDRARSDEGVEPLQEAGL